MKKNQGSAALLSLLALLVLPAWARAGGAVVSSEFIYETAPFPSCHASTIVKAKDGLVASWFGGTRKRAGRLHLRVPPSRREVDGSRRRSPTAYSPTASRCHAGTPSCSSRKTDRCSSSTRSARRPTTGGEC